MYECERTGQLLPILIGQTMSDPSGQEVPILAAVKIKGQRTLRPLAGTMDDPDGKGSPLLSCPLLSSHSSPLLSSPLLSSPLL